MDGKYDVVVLGTGFKESLLGGLLSTDKKNVLTLDRNSFYGGEGASLNLAQLFKWFRSSSDGTEEKIPPKLGLSQKYAVDLCPKFVMASGSLIKILLHTGARNLLDFRSIQGCYVLKGKKLFKVPSTGEECMKTELLKSTQKLYLKSFLSFLEGYDPADSSTHKGYDLDAMTCKDLYNKFKLDATTIHFTGRCLALEIDDSYLDKPAKDLARRIKLYAYSTVRYGNSPFIYPLWGTGGLPEAFSRTCAILGGVFMLNKPIKQVVFDDDLKVSGVEDEEGNTVACNVVIADPSYFKGTDKVENVGRVARAVCLLDHPIEGIDGDSCHIVLPASDCERKSDIYISYVSDKHMVCPQGKFIAVCSSVAEGKEDPEKKEEELVAAELQPAFDLLGEALEKFSWFTDLLEPTGDGDDGLFITSSLDATADFGHATEQVLSIYELIAGSPLDLSSKDLSE